MNKSKMKKDAIESKRAKIRWVPLAVALMFLGVGAVFAFNFPGLGKSQKLKPANGAVTIPLNKVYDGKAHFYRVADGGVEIGFFVVKGSDGTLHTAFDACDVCFHEKKGYFQDGEYMVCKNCNKKFAVSMIGRVGGGGCNPSNLNHTAVGKNVVIKVADIKTGARLF